MNKSILLVSFFVFCFLSNDLLLAQSLRDRRQERKQETEQRQQKPVEEKETVPISKPKPVSSPSAEDPLIRPTRPASTGKTPNVTQPQEPVIAVSAPKPTMSPEINHLIESAEPMVTEAAGGTLNWTEQYIEAVGSSVIDSDRFTIPAQARAMATRGAVVVAQRNLLEVINGVRITSETTVHDMMLMGDYIHTRVDGVIRGAQMVGEPIEKDGMIEVRMRVPMYTSGGLAEALYEHIPKAGTKATLEEKISETTEEALQALAFNIGGQTFDPSLFPVIIDENNNMVLDLSELYNPLTGNFPQFFNATEELFEDLGFDKGIELIDVLRTEPGKIVIDEKNSKRINWKRIIDTAGSIGKFLMLFI